MAVLRSCVSLAKLSFTSAYSASVCSAKFLIADAVLALRTLVAAASSLLKSALIAVSVVLILSASASNFVSTVFDNACSIVVSSAKILLSVSNILALRLD
jgi:hypothetical protein